MTDAEFEAGKANVKTGLEAGYKVGYEQAKKDFERPHGEWIPFSGDSLDVRMKCSVCGSIEMPLARHNFCPNCGASMRKEGETG